MKYIWISLTILLLSCTRKSYKSIVVTDTIHVTVIDTVYVYHYIDTVVPKAVYESEPEEKINFYDRFGIGPNIGAYYSPYAGFDVVIGFGFQYNITQPGKFLRGRHSKHFRKKPNKRI